MPPSNFPHCDLKELGIELSEIFYRKGPEQKKIQRLIEFGIQMRNDS
jgi:hypothetical protein